METLQINENEEMIGEQILIALIEKQTQNRGDVADAQLQAKLLECGMDEQRLGLYMLGHVALDADESDILKAARSTLLREQIAA